jgi:hypothetical protein
VLLGGFGHGWLSMTVACDVTAKRGAALAWHLAAGLSLCNDDVSTFAIIN